MSFLPGHTAHGQQVIGGMPWEDFVRNWCARLRRIVGDTGPDYASLIKSDSGLIVANGADAGKVDVNADSISIGGAFFRNVDVTADLAVSGANGLDTEAEANSTWYAVYLIASTQADGAVAGLLSTSATAPTVPGGYKWFRRVGWVLNSSAGNLYGILNAANDNWFWWNEAAMNAAPFRVLTAGGATAFTDVPCAGIVPSTSTLVMATIILINSTGASAGMFFSARPNGSVWPDALTTRLLQNDLVLNGAAIIGRHEITLGSDRIFEYKVNNALDDAYVDVLGYYDPR